MQPTLWLVSCYKLWPIPYWLLIDVTVAGYCLVVINSAGPWFLAHDAFHGSLCLFSTVPRFVPNFIAPAIIYPSFFT